MLIIQENFAKIALNKEKNIRYFFVDVLNTCKNQKTGNQKPGPGTRLDG